MTSDEWDTLINSLDERVETLRRQLACARTDLKMAVLERYAEEGDDE